MPPGWRMSTDRLAYHYAKTDETDKAVDYLMRFAEKAARSYAHADAVTALQEALVHVARLPVEARDRRTLELTLRLVNSLYFLGRFQETLDALLPQQECLERLQDPTLTGPYYFWLSHTYSYRREAELAAQSAQHAIAAAQQCGDEVTLGKAYYMLAREGFWMCQYPQGVEHGRQAITLLERTEERWWLGQSYWAVGLNYTFMGECAPAMEAVTRAHTIGEAIGNTRLQTYAHVGHRMGLCDAWRLAGGCRGVSAQLRAVGGSDQYRLCLGLRWAMPTWSKATQGKRFAVLEQSIECCIQVQYRGLQGWFTAWLSDAYLLHGQTEQAHDAALQEFGHCQGRQEWVHGSDGPRVSSAVLPRPAAPLQKPPAICRRPWRPSRRSRASWRWGAPTWIWRHSLTLRATRRPLRRIAMRPMPCSPPCTSRCMSSARHNAPVSTA